MIDPRRLKSAALRVLAMAMLPMAIAIGLPAGLNAQPVTEVNVYQITVLRDDRPFFERDLRHVPGHRSDSYAFEQSFGWVHGCRGRPFSSKAPPTETFRITLETPAAGVAGYAPVELVFSRRSVAGWFANSSLICPTHSRYNIQELSVRQPLNLEPGEFIVVPVPHDLTIRVARQ